MVARPRLTGLLPADPPPPVVSIIAPAGYGKTMLLADWAARAQRDVAWLTLDEFDNAPSVFLTYPGRRLSAWFRSIRRSAPPSQRRGPAFSLPRCPVSPRSCTGDLARVSWCWTISQGIGGPAR
jgi:LuxR family maltose regulon positive regulatory protein